MVLRKWAKGTLRKTPQPARLISSVGSGSYMSRNVTPMEFDYLDDVPYDIKPDVGAILIHKRGPPTVGTHEARQLVHDLRRTGNLPPDKLERLNIWMETPVGKMWTNHPPDLTQAEKDGRLRRRLQKAFGTTD